ncbi:MAG: LCCL domain-containing protein [Deltaproteobacteria bacterium]
MNPTTPHTTVSRFFAAACLCLGSACAAQSRGPATPPPSPPVQRPAATQLSWADSATGLRPLAGRAVRVRCPPAGTAGVVWGTDVYAEGSSVCTAALHAGRASLATGGEFDLEVRPPADGYAATLRNGVASREQSASPASFSFVDGPAPGLYAAPLQQPAPPPPRPDPWAENATHFRGQIGEGHSIECPPGTARTVWGTEVYTDDSSVCSAAVHAGRITVETGGRVTFFTQPGRDVYFGSARRGITSNDYGAFPGSFAFDRTPQESVISVPAGARLVNSVANGASLRGTQGAVRFYCPPDMAVRTVWGTGEYTDDSSLCTAAAHAGRIDRATGGVFTVRPSPGHARYRGSVAHEVTSVDYGAFEGSFSIGP